MITRRILVAPVVLALGLAACGEDSPTAPTPPPAEVAGRYWAGWRLQVLRLSDDFQIQFYCSGQITLVQGAASGSVAPLTGFAVMQAPCAPESYELLGTVNAAGVIQFTTDGPAPTEGPCPRAEDVSFSGQVTMREGWRELSARGVATVSCPEFGEHEYTYIIDGSS